MFKIKINGKIETSNQDKKLLHFLRNDLHLTAAKNGCEEGACGSCMVLVNGKAMRSCLLKLSTLSDKEIITVEGIEKKEMAVYHRAFKEAGAVQCGFCIPGMIISTKGLLDKNLQPTEEEIKNALQGNVCRCTGYVKIFQAVKLAAEYFRHGLISQTEYQGKVGERVWRFDADEKIDGTGQYADDLYLPNMLYGIALRVPYPRIRLLSIDATLAKQQKGVATVLTANDIPGECWQGHIVKDWPVMIAVGEESRCIGDAIALVAAETLNDAKEAIEKITFTYDKLKPIVTTKEALANNADKIHKKGNVLSVSQVKRGNVEEALKKATYVVQEKFMTPPTEHAFLEVESAVAEITADGITVYTGTQSVYDDHEGIVSMLGLKDEEVRVISKLVGGGFGGKEDLIVQHHAALLAWQSKRPVKFTLTRNESIAIHPKRHAMEMDYTVGCDQNGKILAIRANIIADTGAYASLGGPVLQRACTHGAGPYAVDNVDIYGQAVYTNNPPAGAFRGFGVTQSCFAMEACLNKLAKMAKISAWEIRFRNAIEPGLVLTNGQIASEDTALKETLLALKEDFVKNKYVGIACAFKNSGLGVGVPDFGRVRLEIKNEKVIVYTSAACMGQGIATTLRQIVSETTGIAIKKIDCYVPDTAKTPDGGTSTASRQTVFNGEAARLAALDLKQDLNTLNDLQGLEGKTYYREYQGLTDPMNSDKENPVSHVAYGYASQLVVLNEDGSINKVVAAHDVGRAINPLTVEGQIEGGVVMGLGYALTEDFPLKEGVPQVKFGTLGLWRAKKIPEIKSIIVEKSTTKLAYGAKGVGEITTIPTAPAVQGAYYELDGEFRTQLPLKNTFYKNGNTIK